MPISFHQTFQHRKYRLNTAMMICLFLASCMVLPQPTYAAGDWITGRKVLAEIKSEKKKGNFPSAVACRNKPSAANRLSPQVKLTWKANPKTTKWVAVFSDGVDNWEPGDSPADKKNWRRISSGGYSVKSGAGFRCSIWYHKNEKTTKGKTRFYIHTKTSSGFRSKQVSQ